MRRRGYILLLLVALIGVAMAGAYEVRGKLRRFVEKLSYPPFVPAQLGAGGPAGKIVLFHPGGITRDDAGNLYITDRGSVTGGRPNQGSIIWKIDSQGDATAVAGSGYRGDFVDDVPAQDATIRSAETIAFDTNGRLLFVDHQNAVVARIEQHGRMTRLAGTGAQGHTGDGGPAIAATLNEPYDIALDAAGNLYIADAANHVIRVVTADGTIRRYAGTGSSGYSGDGGAATEAQLQLPYNITVHPDGGLLIGDSGNNVVRRVDAAGIITTVVGTGERGYSGDGGPAEAAQLDAPQSMQVVGELLYIGDEHNHVIRMVDGQGVITTVIGTGVAGYAKDGTPASRAPLNDPEGFLVNADGTMLVLDSGNHRVLRIDEDGLIQNFAGQGLTTRKLINSHSYDLNPLN